MGNYLIPANSKKSMLIFGVFTTFDLMVFGTGVLFTMILLLTIKTDNIYIMILLILPALSTGTMVMPIPNYHNVAGFLSSLFDYYSNRRNYIWKGWCVKHVYGRDYENRIK